VKALKLLLHDLQSGGDAAAITAANAAAELVDSDDDGESWDDEEKVGDEVWLTGTCTGHFCDCLADLKLPLRADLLGPGAKGFEEDDRVDDREDEDFADDPLSQIDMKV
jgi:hypothetical protein